MPVLHEFCVVAASFNLRRSGIRHSRLTFRSIRRLRERKIVPNTIYWLNFRIEDGETARKPNHKARYEALVEIVEEYALTWWRQSPSLYIFDTNIAIDNLAPLFKKCINAESDYVILGQLDQKEARISGRYNDKDIFQIVPFLKEI